MNIVFVPIKFSSIVKQYT